MHSADSSLSGDEKLVAISNVVSGFDVYNVDSERTLCSLGHSVKSTALRRSPVLFIHNGHALVGGNAHGDVHIWDVASGRKLHSLLHHSKFIIDVFLSLSLLS